VKRYLLSCVLAPLGAFLVGCSNPVFPVNLKEVSFSVTSLVNTNGKVLYPTDASTFTKPTLAFSGVKLRGSSSATGGVTPMTVKLLLYARTIQPSCPQSAGMYMCDKAGEKSLNTVPITLKSDGSSSAFQVDDPNGALKEGINAGKFWLGVEVTEGASLLPTITLSNLIADVTVL
jgi:hypothetical protein